VKSTIGKIRLGAVCLLLTPFAALAALPPKLGIQALFPDFIVFNGDDQWHVGYTLILTNYTKTQLQISSVSVLGLLDQTEVYSQTYTAADLTTMFSSVKGDYETPQEPKLGPGESGVLYFFLDFTSLNNIPQTVRNSFQVTNESGKSDTISIAPLQRRQTGAPEIITAPLQGSGWWTPNGPSNGAVHRRTLIVINGELSITEEFAVDWVKLGPNGATFTGDPLKNESYFAYNQNVLAAAGGRIVDVLDGIAENVPNHYPSPAELDVNNLAGNHIVEDLGDGRFAFYAHLVPGSLRVRVGEVVVPDQVLGRLGNSGNSTQPHLHFHVMDGPQPLGSRGVPFYIANWLRVPHQIVCEPEANCDPTNGPVDLQPGTPVRVKQQAFMNLDLGRF
jgi:murein DD-endopeptidase MepM/ murein hydrolase activator NlpD